MGEYINPKDMTKEQWLSKHGVCALESEIKMAKHFGKSDLIPVCLINNGPFTAAAILYDEREIIEATRADDLRPKSFFLCEGRDLISVCPSVERKLK